MTWPFACQVDGGGRWLRITRGDASVALVAFGMPGDPVPGWQPDDTDARLTSDGTFTARLRHLDDEDGWTTIVSLDNEADVERALPPLGMAVTVASGWAGWSWTSDTEGFLAVAPADAAGPVLLVRVARGFVRASSQRPVFTPRDRVSGAAGDPVAAFHLAHPTGSLRAHGRHQTTLEFSALDRLSDAAGVLPAWLPDLVIAPGDDLVVRTPDMALVPGPGVELATADTTSVMSARPGHREVAVHGVRGVQRLRATFAPAAQPLVADLVEGLRSRRPSAMPSSAAAVVAGGLARRWVRDASGALDWLEREDWLARGDVWAPAIAAMVATETHDEDLLRAACEACVETDAGAGAQLVATRCWLATLRMGMAPLDLTRGFALASDEGLAGFEVAVLRNADADRWSPVADGLAHRLGGALPGQPVGLAEAEAGLLVALLRLVPEEWPARARATEASEKAASLLLADHADGLQPGLEGLAWMLVGEIGS